MVWSFEVEGLKLPLRYYFYWLALSFGDKEQDGNYSDFGHTLVEEEQALEDGIK